MGKILPFKTREQAEREAAVESANEMIAEIRKMFTDEQVQEIKQELEAEEVENIHVDMEKKGIWD